MNNLKITVITGLSGSGKSTALAAYEDAGYYCVDNMPVELLPKFLELPIESNTEIAGLALVMDIREKGFTQKYPSIFNKLREDGHSFSILFLEADEKVLIQRYSQTRRHHPLSNKRNLPEAIETEKGLLSNLRDESDAIINTSHYNTHNLKLVILDIARQSKRSSSLRINVLSFGFKNGLPLNADLVIDVRFLINPYFDPDLKDLNGESDKIRNYVLNNDETRIFLNKYFDLLDYLIPLYEKEGKAYLTLGVGCTGGQHRSVTISRSIYEHLVKFGKQVSLTHRDMV